MRQVFMTAARRLALSVYLIFLVKAGFAATETYIGTLNPENSQPRIPVILEFEEIGGRLLGKAQTSPPLKGEGRFLSGEKRNGDECGLKAYLGEGVSLGMTGRCTTTQYDGIYHLYFPDKQQILTGKFTLKRLKPEKGKKELSESERWRLSSSSNTACLKANSQCLAACPRTGEYNAQFLCANNCKHKLGTCKIKRKKLLQTPVEE
jgi:hypothetical protein